MKKKLSAYWWCQVVGWSCYYCAYAFMAFFKSKSHDFILLFFLFLIIACGLGISHLMHLFWKKTKVFKLKVLWQIIFIFFSIAVFSIIYSIITTALSIVILSPARQKVYLGANFLNATIRDSTYYFIVFSFWNLIYFLYFYIEINRKQQIAALLLESELKIQQLENENSKLQFQKSIADISLAALRSQMNPHFIFNCLNSIKLYTTQNDTVSATEYLSKFSKLIRLVMEESAKEKIVLSSEINMLQLYIEMEAMRFKEKLQYKINVAKDVETDYVELPPMLLQPYVENAIWHGLMPKEEGGKIDIDVAIDNDKSLLEVIITDDGIGRIKSAELKNKTATTKHESFGMKVTSERITLINKIYKTDAEVRVEDLINANGSAAGTKVSIKIPV